MKVTITEQAPPNSKFGPRAFDSAVGQQVPLRIAGTSAGSALLVSADVEPDGHTVQLVLELPLSPGVEELANRLAGVDWQGLLSVPFAQPGGADA